MSSFMAAHVYVPPSAISHHLSDARQGGDLFRLTQTAPSPSQPPFTSKKSLKRRGHQTNLITKSLNLFLLIGVKEL